MPMQSKKDRTFMTRITKHLFFAGILAMSCACPVSAFAAKPAEAQTPAPKSKAPQALVKSGEAKYLAGDYSGALADFSDADAQKPSPQAARYIGLCQDKLGRLSEAVAAYKRFLIAPSPELAPQVDPIRGRVSEILATPGKIHVDTTPAGATVKVDDATTISIGPADLTLAPGKHTLHVSAENHIAKDYDIDVSYASTQTVNVTLDDAPPPPPVVVAPPPPTPNPVAPSPLAPPHHGVSRKVVAVAAGGLAIVAAGIGTAFGVIALNDKNDFDKNPTFDKGNQANDFAVYCDTALGAAAVLGVTSIILFATDHDDAPVTSSSKNAPTFSAAPMMTPHGGGASALLRF
jgi:hypothetical protein